MTLGNELRCAGQMRRNHDARQRGTAGQYEAVDEMLAGRENVELVGRLYHLARAGRRWAGPAAGAAAPGSAGGRPPALDAGRYKERNTVERCFSKLKQFRAVATRYDKREPI